MAALLIDRGAVVDKQTNGSNEITPLCIAAQVCCGLERSNALLRRGISKILFCYAKMIEGA